MRIRDRLDPSFLSVRIVRALTGEWEKVEYHVARGETAGPDWNNSGGALSRGKLDI